MVALEFNDIVLAVIMALVFALCIFALRRVRATFISMRTAIVLMVAGVLVAIYLWYNRHMVGPADWSQMLLVVGLIIVTTMYAVSAFRQAHASIKMAEEMREQRYDGARPVVDIQRKEELDTRIREALAAESRETSYGLHCVLRNIGLGPALDVCSFIQTPGGERKRWEFGTLPTEGETERERLSLLQSNNNQWELVAYYRDVYGRAFKSSREVNIDELDNTKWNVGPLRVRLIKEEELP